MRQQAAVAHHFHEMRRDRLEGEGLAAFQIQYS
jgi:hypothetical protein